MKITHMERKRSGPVKVIPEATPQAWHHHLAFL